MTRSSKYHRQRYRQQLHRLKSQPTGGWILGCALSYGLAGLLLTYLPHLAWIGFWPLACLGGWLQVWGLTQPAPSHPRLFSLDQLGTGLLTIALAAALNYLGNSQINDVSFLGLMGQILVFSVLGLLLATLCRQLTVILSQRLQPRFSDSQSRAILTTALGLGLILGGLAGLLLKLL